MQPLEVSGAVRPLEWSLGVKRLILRITILDNGDIIIGCTEFRYLVSIFTKGGRETKIIRHRVTKARIIIGAIYGVWWSKVKVKVKVNQSRYRHGVAHRVPVS